MSLFCEVILYHLFKRTIITENHQNSDKMESIMLKGILLYHYTQISSTYDSTTHLYKTSHYSVTMLNQNINKLTLATIHLWCAVSFVATIFLMKDK